MAKIKPLPHHLAVQFDSDANFPLKSDNISNWNNAIYWKCSIGHSWQSSPANRIRRKSTDIYCPCCMGRTLSLDGSNSFAACYPELVDEWISDITANKQPSELTVDSKNRIRWQCKTNIRHVWEAILQTRTGAKARGCPFCAGQRILPEASIVFTHPNLSQEFHPTLNGNLTVEQISQGSSKKNVLLIQNIIGKSKLLKEYDIKLAVKSVPPFLPLILGYWRNGIIVKILIKILENLQKVVMFKSFGYVSSGIIGKLV